jgi:hypothetical protein
MCFLPSVPLGFCRGDAFPALGQRYGATAVPNVSNPQLSFNKNDLGRILVMAPSAKSGSIFPTKCLKYSSDKSSTFAVHNRKLGQRLCSAVHVGVSSNSPMLGENVNTGRIPFDTWHGRAAFQLTSNRELRIFSRTLA